jgi:hypothetical protein
VESRWRLEAAPDDRIVENRKLSASATSSGMAGPSLRLSEVPLISTFGGLTQFRISPQLGRRETAECKHDRRTDASCEGVWDNLMLTARNPLILETERCPSG